VGPACNTDQGGGDARGGHHFGGGYAELAAVILRRLPVLSAQVLAP